MIQEMTVKITISDDSTSSSCYADVLKEIQKIPNVIGVKATAYGGILVVDHGKMSYVKPLIMPPPRKEEENVTRREDHHNIKNTHR